MRTGLYNFLPRGDVFFYLEELSKTSILSSKATPRLGMDGSEEVKLGKVSYAQCVPFIGALNVFSTTASKERKCKHVHFNLQINSAQAMLASCFDWGNLNSTSQNMRVTSAIPGLDLVAKP